MCKPCACMFPLGGWIQGSLALAWKIGSGVLDDSSGPAHSLCLSWDLLMAQRSRGWVGAVWEHVEGKVLTSSRWVGMCPAHGSTGTQPGSKVIPDLHGISEALTEQPCFGMAFSFPRERRHQSSGHSFLSCGPIKQLRSCRQG